jgi:glutaredoxin
VRSLFALTLLLQAFAAGATAYKWVDSEGRVNYGDRPPDNLRTQALKPPTAAPASSETADAGLPLQLRAVAARNPVTFYTVRDCGACDSLRAHLLRRGVPFAERSVQSDRDSEAFRQLGFSMQAIPTLSIGRDRLTGYDPQRLDAVLDAAGYPRESMLPAGWRPASPRPLAPATQDEPPARTSSESPSIPAPLLPAPPPQRPGTIRF